MQKYLFVGLILLIAVGGGIFWLAGRGQDSGVSFRTEKTSRGEMLATVGGTGTLEPEEVIDVGTQVAGLIKEFGVGVDGKQIDYGSPVDRGTVLARIDDSLYSARADQTRALLRSAEQRVIQAKAKVDEAVAATNKARADLKQSQSRANQSGREWTRAKSVKASGAISDTDFDAAQSAYEINNAAVSVAEAVVVQAVATEADVRAAVGDAEAAVATARAVLRQDEINLGYCTIKSDVAGTIIDRRVTIGQTVQSSFNTPSLFLIAKDLKRMKVWASVNESDIGQIHVGQPVAFTVDAYPKNVYTGTVDRIRLNATNTQNVVIYTVEVLTENSKGELLPYMTANLKFEVNRRADVLRVPNAALRYRPATNLIVGEATKSNEAAPAGDKPNRGIVYVEEAGKVRPMPIELGLTDGTMTEVLSGDLQPDQLVVVGEARKSGTANSTENPFAPKLGGKKQ